MAKKRRKRPRDPIQLAMLVGDIATGEAKDEERESQPKKRPPKARPVRQRRDR